MEAGPLSRCGSVPRTDDVLVKVDDGTCHQAGVGGGEKADSTGNFLWTKDPPEGPPEWLVACEAGASGFMVGRTLWKDAVTAPASERSSIVEAVVRPRFRELVAIARGAGSDWADRHVLPAVDERWYQTY